MISKLMETAAIHGTTGLLAFALPHEAKFDANLRALLRNLDQIEDLSYCSAQSPYYEPSEAINKRFAEIESLQDNWNGYGARKIESTLIEKAKPLAYEIEKYYSNLSIFPTARDSIQIEYRNIHKDYIEIEIFSEAYVVAIIRPDETEDEFELETEEQVIEKVL